MTRLRADLPTETTLSLVLYYYLTRQRLCYAYSPTDRTTAPIRQRSTNETMIVLICLRSTDRPIDELYVQPLSPPDARTVLLPESDNCRACTPATRRPNDRACTPAIHRPNDRACTPATHRPNDRACTPTINRPTGRQAPCLTTITTAAGTVLPPEWTFAALLPFYSATSKKKNCQKLLIELSKVDNGTRACYLRRPADPDFNQPIRIFHARHEKSLLARLPLAPWRPSQDVHLLPTERLRRYACDPTTN